MTITVYRIWTILLLVLLTWCSAGAAPEAIRPGDSFPELQLSTPTATDEQQYLQLNTAVFTPSQIKCELLLVELLNVHCPHCQMQSPAYNELFKLIEANPESRDSIKLLGIATGNLPREVEAFKKGYQVKFPIIADPAFSAWRQIGAGATPVSIYVRQDQPGKPGIVTGVHLGLNTDYQDLYQRLLKMAKTDLNELRHQAQTVAEKQRNQQPEPILSATKLEYRVRSAFTSIGRIEDFSELSLLSRRKVYAATIRRGQETEKLFAEVTSRGSICDICHDVHFIYLFDRSAQIIGFEPLQLTKYGNVNWNQAELDRMKSRVIGRYLSMPHPFDPKVDAVSSATMTSAIIFDSLAQGDELLQELRTLGLMN